MDKNNSIAYLDEILKNLCMYGEVHISIEGEYIRADTPVNVLKLANGRPIKVEFEFLDGSESDFENYTAERVIPFEASRYFVKGQGKSFARSMKREVANKLFDLGI